jgi:hypothetical protein
MSELVLQLPFENVWLALYSAYMYFIIYYSANDGSRHRRRTIDWHKQGSEPEVRFPALCEVSSVLRIVSVLSWARGGHLKTAGEGANFFVPILSSACRF